MTDETSLPHFSFFLARQSVQLSKGTLTISFSSTLQQNDVSLPETNTLQYHCRRSRNGNGGGAGPSFSYTDPDMLNVLKYSNNYPTHMDSTNKHLKSARLNIVKESPLTLRNALEFFRFF